MEKWFVTSDGWGNGEALVFNSEAEARAAVEEHLFEDYRCGDIDFTFTIYKGKFNTHAALSEHPAIKYF